MWFDILIYVSAGLFWLIMLFAAARLVTKMGMNTTDEKVRCKEHVAAVKTSNDEKITIS